MRRGIPHEQALINGVKSIDILFGRNAEESLKFIQPFRKRQLEQDSVNVSACAEILQCLLQDGINDRFRKMYVNYLHANTLCAFGFTTHIDLGGWIAANEDYRKPWGMSKFRR
jgi:hypothetical protein